MKENILKSIGTIFEQQKELHNLCVLLKEEYTEKIDIVAKNNSFKPKFFPRIEYKGERVYVEWSDFSKRNKSIHIAYEKRKRIYGERIIPTKTKGYTRKCFKGAFDAEYAMIEFYESIFVSIRKKSEMLKKAEFYLKKAIQVDEHLEEAYELISDQGKD